MLPTTFHLADDVNPQARNFAARQRDYAVFLPSISAIFVRQASNPSSRVPTALPGGLTDLDFLNPQTNLFYYPAALYSSGHSVWDLEQSDRQESMVQKRDRSRTVIVGDSGGYQIATGVLKWPWQKKAQWTDGDWTREKDKIRLQILRWLEHSTDYSMVLDVPTGSLLKFGYDELTGENLHPGVKNFRDCLNSSLENHEFFIKNRREGATKFMNVLQGRNQAEGDVWWDAVKDLPFETWAFSNVQASNFAINLRRIIIMRDQGYLEGRDWIHYLGNGKIKAGCALTTLQRSMRKLINPKLTLSYDAASPFVMVAKGHLYHSWVCDDRAMAFKSGTMPDDKSLKGSSELLQRWIKKLNKKWPDRITSISQKLPVGDLCVKGYQDLQYKKTAFTTAELANDKYPMSWEGQHGEKHVYSREYREYLDNQKRGLWQQDAQREWHDHEKYQVKWPSSLDGMSYVLGMHHNVEMHLDAIISACHDQDLPLSQATQLVTPDLLEFAHGLCDEILTSERPMDLINKHAKMLGRITGMDADNHIHLDLKDI
tara:strand:- start:15537 stop:17162 length:1626 start_codon:yes stop_codon:yes gene_type:complete